MAEVKRKKVTCFTESQRGKNAIFSVFITKKTSLMSSAVICRSRVNYSFGTLVLERFAKGSDGPFPSRVVEHAEKVKPSVFQLVGARKGI